MKQSKANGIIRQTLVILCLLFTVLIVIPTWLSFGTGIRFKLFGLQLHHHRATITVGVFSIVVLLIFFGIRWFRKGILETVELYDHLPPRAISYLEISSLCVLALWLSFLKWQRSYLLLSHTFDHGIFLNIFWNSAHGNWFWNSFRQMNFLGDHFSPFLAIITVPYFFVNSESLPLILQTAAMLFAVWLIVRIATSIHPVRPAERLLLIFLFVSNEYFQRVDYYDFHPIAFAIPLVCGMYIFAKREPQAFVLLLPFALFTIQEDASLMVGGLALYLALTSAKRFRWLSILGICAIALWINSKLLIPQFAGGESSLLARYKTMGGDMKVISENFFLRPWIPAQLLFSSDRIIPLLRVFATFGFLPFASLSSVALLPSVLEHSLSDYAQQYEYRQHYSANLLPFLMIGTVIVLSKYKIRYERLIPVVLVLIAFSAFNNRQYIRPQNMQMVGAVRALAHELGPEEIVSVQGSIGVPFSFRRKAYSFPEIHDASWIVLATGKNPWPLTREEHQKEVERLKKDPQWKWQEKNGVLVFEKHRR